MSFFMLRMPSAGLMSRPPVSKHTPLPTSTSAGSVSLPQRSTTRRGARCEARPTAWMAGKFCFSSASPVIASTSAPCASASARAASSSCCGPMSSVGVLTQSRTRRLAVIRSAASPVGAATSCAGARWRLR
ncbi:hypothetical protein G6F35_017851 [Rhizopus arrhizus]|nr:hypothetical protein G6F35_017851 [Rhizopus arrhizus]